MFAVGFERYIMRSKSPKRTLKLAFSAFSQWIHDVYQNIGVLYDELLFMQGLTARSIIDIVKGI